MKNCRYLFALAFILLMAACSAPGTNSRKANPIKISALNETVWSYLQQDGTYFVIAFKGSGTSYQVGSSSSNNLPAAATQALASANNKTTYDSKNPGEILLHRPGGDEIFRPVDQREAELISKSPSSPKPIIKMTRYK